MVSFNLIMKWQVMSGITLETRYLDNAEMLPERLTWWVSRQHALCRHSDI